MNTAEQTHQQDLERLKSLRYMDDDFMSVCLADNFEGVELEKGVAAMCKIMEDMRNEAAREAAQKAEQNKAKRTAVHLIKLGKMTLEEIAEATELSLDIVKELESQSMQSA